MGQAGITPLGKIGMKYARIKHPLVREFIGEFIGTTILTFMIVGASAQYLVKMRSVGFESQVVPILGTIFGIMIAMVVTGGVSGAHLNPAVSIANALYGEMSWIAFPVYVLAQTIGSVVGSLLAWSLIHPSIRQVFGIPSDRSIPEYDENELHVHIAGIFGPVKPGITVGNGIATELLETFHLIIIILAACDTKSSFRPPKYLLSLVVPMAIAGLCFSHDVPTGTVMNPVRDLGPRIAAWILGWKTDSVFKNYDIDGNHQHWWLVGLIGPMLGAVLATLVYAFILGPQLNLGHLEEEEEEGNGPRFPDVDSRYNTGGKQRTEEVLAAQRTGDTGSDWRSTVFVPKPHVSAPVTHVGGNNNNYQMNYPNGQQPYANQQGYQNQNKRY